MAEWEVLFDKAMLCLDSLAKMQMRPPEWSFGGGTVLMLKYAHRASKDIDIFLTDVQYLPALSPRLNDVSEAIAEAGGYSEQSNCVKITTLEGEIDFVAAPHLAATPYVEQMIHGRKVRVETPEEIIVKKLFYRAVDLHPRDVFDAAVVIKHDRGVLDRNHTVLQSRLSLLFRRMDELESIYDTGKGQLQVLPDGRPFLATAWDVLNKALRDLNRV